MKAATRSTNGESTTSTIAVGYLINQYPKPSHTFIRTEMRELERQGHRVVRLAIRGWEETPGSPLDAEEQAATDYVLKAGVLALAIAMLIRTVRAPLAVGRALSVTWKLGRGSQAGLLKHLIYLLEACWTLQWAKQRQVTHIHAHFGTNTAAVATLVHALGGPSFSFTVHGPDEFDAPRQLKLREKAKAAAFVIAITSYCRSQLFRWVDPQDWSKIKIVRCTPDPTFLEAESATAEFHGQLVCVGRLCEQKGQLTLIEALRRLAADGIRVRLVLAGDGPMRADIERAARAAGLESWVRITGWINSGQVKDELLAADALVLPSFAEGLPVVIMEAMALGRPVLSTIIAGIPELVREGCDGFLVPAGDSSLFADAIKRFLNLSDAQRQQLGANCRERVRHLHVPARQAAYLAELIANGGTALRTN
jgi:glycosyltransferase involved in cell wall biosynthesis